MRNGTLQPPAFYGEFLDYRVERARRTFVPGIELPFSEFGRFASQIGFPAQAMQGYGTGAIVGASVMLLACRAPRPPEPDVVPMDEAAIAYLEQRVALGGLVPNGPAGLRLDALIQIVGEVRRCLEPDPPRDPS